MKFLAYGQGPFRDSNSLYLTGGNTVLGEDLRSLIAFCWFLCYN